MPSQVASKHGHESSTVNPSLGHDEPEVQGSSVVVLPTVASEAAQRRGLQRARDQHLMRDQQLSAALHVSRRVDAVRPRTMARRGSRDDAAEEARPNHASPLSRIVILHRGGHQGRVRSAQAAPAPRKLVAPGAPGASLPAAMGLAEVRAPLRALVAPVEPATLATTVLHAAIGTTTRALGATWDNATFAPSMRHAEAGSAVNALWAHPASLKEAPLSAAMPFAEWRAAFSTPGTAFEHAPFASTVGLAEDGASLGSLAAVWVLAPTAASVRDAQPRLSFRTPSAALNPAPLPSTMFDAES
jgi:hypothetical protein